MPYVFLDPDDALSQPRSDRPSAIGISTQLVGPSWPAGSRPQRRPDCQGPSCFVRDIGNEAECHRGNNHWLLATPPGPEGSLAIHLPLHHIPMAPESLVSKGSGPWGYFNQPTSDRPCDASAVSINEEAASVQSEDDRRPPTPAGSNARRVIRTRDSRSRHGRASARSDAASDLRSVIDDLTLENRKLKEELRRFQQKKDAPLLHMDQILEVKCHGLSARDKRDLELVLRNFATSSKGSSVGSLPSGTRHGSRTAKSLARSSASGLRSRRETARPDAGRSSPAASPRDGPLELPQAAEANDENNLHQSLGGIRSHLVGLSENGKKELVVRRLEQLFTGKSWGYAPHAPSPLALMSTSEDAAMTGADSREAHIDHGVQQLDYQDAKFSSPMSGKQEHARHAGGSVGPHDDEASPLAPRPREQRATRPHELDPHRPQSSAQNMDYIRHLGFSMPKTKPFTVLDALPEADGWVHLNLLSSLAQLGMLNVTQTFIRNAVAEKSDKLQLSSDGKLVHWRGGTEGTRFGPPAGGGGGAHGRDASPGDDHGPRARKKQRIWNANEDDGATAEDACPAPSRRKASSAEKDFHYKPLFAHRQHHGDRALSEPFSETRPSPFDDDDDDDASLACAWPRERNASDALFRSDMGSPGGGGDATPRKRSRDGAIYFYAGAPFYMDLSGDRGVYEPTSPTSPPPPPGHAADAPSPRYEHVSTGLSDPLVRWRRDDDDDGPSDQFSTDSGVDLGEWNDDNDDEEGSKDDDVAAPSLTTLETSGLAGVVPLDHFVVSIFTRQRTVSCAPPPPSTTTYWSAKARASSPPPVQGLWNCAGVARLVAARRVSKAATASFSPSPSGPFLPRPSWAATPVVAVKVEYMSGGQLRLLPPVPPPPPVHVLSWSSNGDPSSGSEEEEGLSLGVLEGGGKA